MQGEQDWGGTRAFSARPVAVAALVAGVVAVGAMWGPWVRSGSADRDSFGVFRAAQVLGIEWVTPFRVAWFLLPVLLPLAVALLAFGARRWSAAVLLLLGLLLAVFGGLAVAGFGFLWGGGAAAVAGTCTTLLAVAMFRPARVGRSGRPPDLGDQLTEF